MSVRRTETIENGHLVANRCVFYLRKRQNVQLPLFLFEICVRLQLYRIKYCFQSLPQISTDGIRYQCQHVWQLESARINWQNSTVQEKSCWNSIIVLVSLIISFFLLFWKLFFGRLWSPLRYHSNEFIIRFQRNTNISYEQLL